MAADLVLLWALLLGWNTFFPLWLRAQGLDVEAIGIVLAAPMVVRLLSVPLTSRLVDQWGSLHGGLVAASIGTAFGYTMVALVDGFPAVLAAVALASIPFTLTGPLAEAYAPRGSPRVTCAMAR